MVQKGSNSVFASFHVSNKRGHVRHHCFMVRIYSSGVSTCHSLLGMCVCCFVTFSIYRFSKPIIVTDFSSG